MSQSLVPSNQNSSLAPTNVGQALTLPEKLRYCDYLAQADMLPANYAKKPANVLVALELGEVLGLAPITTLLEVYVVNNRPSMSARLMATLARKAGHRVETVSDREGATTTVTRRDTQQQYQVTFSKEDATKANLLSKDGPWKTYPQRMYEARSIAACVRLACPEVLMGVVYTPEELGDPKAEFIGETVSESSTRPAEEPGTAKAYTQVKVSEPEPVQERPARTRRASKPAEEQAPTEPQAPPAEAPSAPAEQSQQVETVEATFEDSLPENDTRIAPVPMANEAWEMFKKLEGHDPKTGEILQERAKARLKELFGIESLRHLTIGQAEKMKAHVANESASF